MPSQAPPALYDHCVKVYSAMMETAEPGWDEGSGAVYYVWTGKTTQLFIELGLSTPYYTSVMQKLRAMNCLVQVQRGGGGSASVWHLYHAPTEALFHSSKDKVTGRPSKNDSLEQKLRDMAYQIAELNDRVDFLEGMAKR